MADTQTTTKPMTATKALKEFETASRMIARSDEPRKGTPKTLADGLGRLATGREIAVWRVQRAEKALAKAKETLGKMDAAQARRDAALKALAGVDLKAELAKAQARAAKRLESLNQAAAAVQAA